MSWASSATKVTRVPDFLGITLRIMQTPQGGVRPPSAWSPPHPGHGLTGRLWEPSGSITGKAAKVGSFLRSHAKASGPSPDSTLDDLSRAGFLIHKMEKQRTGTGYRAVKFQALSLVAGTLFAISRWRGTLGSLWKDRLLSPPWLFTIWA